MIETKSSAIDLVTDVDRASDELIVRRISDTCSDDSILTGVFSTESAATLST